MRHFGLSEAGVETIRRAMRWSRDGLQSEYSLFRREPEDAYLAALDEPGSASSRSAPGARLPHGHGGRHHGVSQGKIPARLPRFRSRRARPIWLWSKRVRAAAERNAPTPARSRSPGAGPAPVARPDSGHPTPSRLDENLGAAELTPTADDLAELDQASTEVKVVGDQYPESM